MSSEVIPGGASPEPDHRYRLDSALTFATVPTVRPRLEELLAGHVGGAPLVVDLSGVPQADSAGLALLVDWLAAARARGHSLRYAAAGESLRALARLSDVEALIAG